MARRRVGLPLPSVVADEVALIREEGRGIVLDIRIHILVQDGPLVRRDGLEGHPTLREINCCSRNGEI